MEFNSGFKGLSIPTKTLYVFLFYPIRATTEHD